MSPYDHQLDKLNDAYECAIKALIEWIIEHWQHDTKEQWKNCEPYPSDDFVKGWNTAINSLDGALGVFMEEHLR